MAVVSIYANLFNYYCNQIFTVFQKVLILRQHRIEHFDVKNFPLYIGLFPLDIFLHVELLNQKE
jgi:hypothetical protein